MIVVHYIETCPQVTDRTGHMGPCLCTKSAIGAKPFVASPPDIDMGGTGIAAREKVRKARAWDAKRSARDVVVMEEI
jgi:hypothetical protein